MISCKIDDSLIYEILNFIANSPNMTTTLREIVDNTSLTDYNSGNTAISEISKMGLLAGRANGDVITVTLDARGCGKLFLDNYKYVSRLTAKEKPGGLRRPEGLPGPDHRQSRFHRPLHRRPLPLRGPRPRHRSEPLELSERLSNTTLMS